MTTRTVRLAVGLLLAVSATVTAQSRQYQSTDPFAVSQTAATLPSTQQHGTAPSLLTVSSQQQEFVPTAFDYSTSPVVAEPCDQESCDLCWDNACDDACDDACDESCLSTCTGDAPRIYADFEMLYVRFHEEGGVEDADGNAATFDYQWTPRIEAGVYQPGGFGVRGRYWSFNERTVSSADRTIDVQTWYADVEVMQELRLPGEVSVIASGGVRWAQFDDVLQEDVGADALFFEGFGGVAGLELRRGLFCGNVYLRGRLAATMGDIAAMDDGEMDLTRLDATTLQTEVGFGYELRCTMRCGASAWFRTGLEFHDWTNVGLADELDAGGTGQDDQTEDVGFGGFVLGAGVSR